MVGFAELSCCEMARMRSCWAGLIVLSVPSAAGLSASMPLLRARTPSRGAVVTASLLPATGLLADEAIVAAQTFEPRGVTPEDTIVFILGTIPFLWATVEFWSRIARGDSFGTGKDSVIINDTSGNRKRPLQRVLGQDAIIAAYILFAIAFASGVLVLVAFFDVGSTPQVR